MAMVLLGALFVYAGINNLSVQALIKGDNSVKNAGSTSTTSTTPGQSSLAGSTASGAPSAVTNPGSPNNQAPASGTSTAAHGGVVK